MSKIKKFFTTIISAIVCFFVKMGVTNAEAPIPSSSGSVPLYGVPSIPIGIRILQWINWGLLLFILPILVILGITTLVRIRSRKKEQAANIEYETVENQEIEMLNKRLKIIKILILIMAAIVAVILVILNAADVRWY